MTNDLSMPEISQISYEREEMEERREETRRFFF